MCTTVSMKSVGEKLVVGPCLKISASRKENKTRKSSSLSCWLRPKLGHEDSHKGINVMFDMPSQQIRCFLLLRGEIFADPCRCQSCNDCFNVGVKYKFQEMFDVSTYEIRFSPNPLFWGRPQYSPPNTPESSVFMRSATVSCSHPAFSGLIVDYTLSMIIMCWAI